MDLPGTKVTARRSTLRRLKSAARVRFIGGRLRRCAPGRRNYLREPIDETSVEMLHAFPQGRQILFAISNQSCKFSNVSVEQLESQVLALPVAQRRAFTRWLDEHRDEIEQPSILAGAQEGEIRQRLAEMEADPAMR